MKKTLVFFLAVITFLGFGFTFNLQAQNQSLADKTIGEFKGKLRNQDHNLTDYKIKITKVSDQVVKIQPVSGSSSQTFEVKLTEQIMGSVTMIKFKLPGDHIMNNGMFVEQNGRLSYSMHLGGDNPRNIEVFTGTKSGSIPH